MNLLLHPVFKRLLQVKWSNFAHRKHCINLLLQLLFVVLWSIVGVTTPADSTREYSKPIAEVWWRIVLETFAVFITFYFILVVSLVKRLFYIFSTDPILKTKKGSHMVTSLFIRRTIHIKMQRLIQDSYRFYTHNVFGFFSRRLNFKIGTFNIPTHFCFKLRACLTVVDKNAVSSCGTRTFNFLGISSHALANLFMFAQPLDFVVFYYETRDGTFSKMLFFGFQLFNLYKVC